MAFASSLQRHHLSLFGVLAAFTAISSALDYTQNQFDVDNARVAQFVMFHAPWCGHCKRLRPLWNQLEEHYGVDSMAVKIAKVDCTVDTRFCVRENIKAYPTLRLYNKKLAGDTFRGERKLETFVTFVDDNLAEKEKARKDAPPEVVELTEATFYSHTATGLHFVEFFAPWCAHCQHLAPVWARLANEMPADSGIDICQVNCVKDEKVCKEQGITAYPMLIVYHQSMKVEDYLGDRTIGHLKAFANQMTAKYKSHLSKEELHVPTNVKIETQMSPSLQDTFSLHADNFDGVISDNKHTFAMFYKDGCAGCDTFFPIWNDLALRMVEEDRPFKIAKIDCGQEEFMCNRYRVVTYPKLIHFRPTGVGELYSGALTFDSLYKYIRFHDKDEL